jgi:hypothetical protein
LAIGGVAAALVVAVMFARDEEPENAETRARQAARQAAAPEDAPVADVKLEVLKDTRPQLADARRNLFRFEQRQAPPSPSRPTSGAPMPGLPPSSALPPAPPALPSIPLRFIGLVDAPTQAGRVAILSDGRGNIFYGKEGAIIEGRYKVLTVSADVVELSYIDGRGRQTVRLSGQ